jgi:hypothetical protein
MLVGEDDKDNEMRNVMEITVIWLPPPKKLSNVSKALF